LQRSQATPKTPHTTRGVLPKNAGCKERTKSANGGQASLGAKINLLTFAALSLGQF